MIHTIRLYTIPQSAQRYKTVGDWFEHNGETHIVASNLENQKMEFLVLIHELIEATLCRNAGISQEEVDRFDKAWEDVQEGEDAMELGDMRSSPYQRQHCIATGIERLLAAELGVCWSDYEARLQEEIDDAE